jgi:DNA (cytosine-5)-methyltransferase 1
MGYVRSDQPASAPLENAQGSRIGRLKGYGNAIVPAVAAELIAAYLENSQ